MARIWFSSLAELEAYLFVQGFRRDDEGEWRRSSWHALPRKSRKRWTYYCI